MGSIAIYPGSFDPVTNGHLDIVERASRVFDRVIMAVIVNPNKAGFFPLTERRQLLCQVTAHLTNVEIDAFSGLLVDYARQQGARAVVKGLRSPADCEAELQMARLNHMMAPEVETFLMASQPGWVHVSSSFVREIARLGGDISSLVAPSVLTSIQSKLKAMREEK